VKIHLRNNMNFVYTEHLFNLFKTEFRKLIFSY